MARPTIYTDEIALEICMAIASSNRGIKPLCEKNPHWPSHSTIRKWIFENKEFSDKYELAKQEQADFISDEILEIADHTEEDHTAFIGSNVVQRDRLRIDARKWIASKLKPKKYGDRLDLNHEGGQTIIVKFQDEAE
jgi:hypothetical protein